MILYSVTLNVNQTTKSNAYFVGVLNQTSSNSLLNLTTVTFTGNWKSTLSGASSLGVYWANSNATISMVYVTVTGMVF